MASKKKRLPSEYQEVEWIGSTGTQYILFPYGFDPTDYVEINASIETGYDTDKFVLSSSVWNDSGKNRFAIVGIYASKYGVAYGNRPTSNTVLRPYTRNDGGFHTWKYSSKVFEVTDLDLLASVEQGFEFINTTSNLKLFYGYNSNTKGKLAYYKHTKNANTYEFIPCYRKTNLEIGLYDIINDVFYANDGTGTFTKGADV